MKDNKLIKSGVSGVVDGENQTVGDDELEPFYKAKSCKK